MITPSFVEIRLDQNLSRSAGGYIFNTRTSASASGLENRISHTTIPLFQGDIGNIIVDQCQLEYLIAFFNARKGRAQGFRYKYYADYKCSAQPEFTTDNYTFSQGVTIPREGNGINTEFQIAKLYRNAGEETIKPLFKIVPDTVKAFISDSEIDREITDFGVDLTTGKIYFNQAPPNNANITVECEFDLPVRFDIDEFVGVQEYVDTAGLNQTGKILYTFSSLPVVEFVPSQPIEIALSCPVITSYKDDSELLVSDLSLRLSVPSITYGIASVSTRNKTQVNLKTGFESDVKQICHAFLYWNIHGNYQPSSTINFDGTPITGNEIGRSGHTCWGEQGNQVFRADITSTIQNNLKSDYVIDGLIENGIQNNGQGIAMLLLYLPVNNSETNQELYIYDGSCALNVYGANRSFGLNQLVINKVTTVMSDCQNYGDITVSIDDYMYNIGNTGGASNPEIYVNDITLPFNQPYSNLKLTVFGDCVNLFLIVMSSNNNNIPD